MRIQKWYIKFVYALTLRHRWEDNIKMDLKKIGFKGLDWIHIARDDQPVVMLKYADGETEIISSPYGANSSR
jgi:hypothetical protein